MHVCQCESDRRTGFELPERGVHVAKVQPRVVFARACMPGFLEACICMRACACV
jgi:hypothetical protein